MRGFLKGLPSGVNVLAGSLTEKGAGIVTVDAIFCAAPQPHPLLSAMTSLFAHARGGRGKVKERDDGAGGSCGWSEASVEGRKD